MSDDEDKDNEQPLPVDPGNCYSNPIEGTDGCDSKDGGTSRSNDKDPLVTAILGKLDTKFDILNAKFDSVKTSLEFSQEDVDDLKSENRELRNKITQLELEEKRNELQFKSLESRVDRLDTNTRKKNLILDGIVETPDGKDNFQPLLYQLFRQIGITRQIDIDTCYRVGPLCKNKCCPITIIFQRQADRDEVYSQRAQMKKTQDFHDVWINEDLGQISRRVNTTVRLLAKEAQRQGIPHKPSKYSITLNDKRYDEKNFDEIPPLSPYMTSRLSSLRDS